MNIKETKKEREIRKAGERTTARALFLVISLVVVVLAVFGLVAYLDKSGTDSGPTEVGNLPAVTAEDHIIGNLATAKAVLIEYGDFECPACGDYEPMVKSLVQKYQSQGLVFAYRHYPLPQHNKALLAAQVTEAAARQGKFWEMHDKLYASQDDWSTKTPAEALALWTGYARTLGLAIPTFENDVKLPEVIEDIRADQRGGDEAGVAGTPTFYLNGTVLEARTEGDFEAALKAALALPAVPATTTVVTF